MADQLRPAAEACEAGMCRLPAGPGERPPIVNAVVVAETDEAAPEAGDFAIVQADRVGGDRSPREATEDDAPRIPREEEPLLLSRLYELSSHS